MKKSVGKVTLKSKKKRTSSSRAWLLRQLNDPYVHKAKQDGYRSRAAYKLLEIHQKYKVFKQGQKVIDLGAAPGGWTQVIAKIVYPRGLVIALDLQDVQPFQESVVILKGDFEDSTVQQELSNYIDKADVIVSDMAAPSCGIPSVDHLRIINLLESTIAFSLIHLKEGGTFIAKVLRGGTEKDLLQMLKKNFSKVSHFKPESSRQDSAEMYVIAQNFQLDKLLKISL